MPKKIAEHEIKFLLTAKNETKKSFSNITSALPNMKTLALGAAKAIAAIGIAASITMSTSVVAFAGFETALTDMTRVTNENLDDIKETMLSLPPELGGATELVKGYYNVISAGVTKPGAALELLTTAAKASNSAHLELDTTVSGITNLMDGFGGSIESAAIASDKLFTIEKIGKTRFSELAPVIGQVASSANILGVDIDELGGLFATVTKTAGSTEVAATQVKAIFNSLLRPSSDMNRILDEMGFRSAGAAISSRGLVSVLHGLNEEIRQENTTLQDLFKNQRALNGIAPAFQNNLEILDDNIGEMSKSTGATDEAFQAWSKTLKGVWKTFKNTIGNMAIEFGEQLAPSIKTALTSIITYLQQNKDSILEWSSRIVIATGKVFTSLLEIGGQVITSIGEVVGAIIRGYNKIDKEADKIEVKRGITTQLKNMKDELASINLELDKLAAERKGIEFEPPATILESIGSVARFIKESFGLAFEGVKLGFRTMWDGFVGFFTNVRQGIFTVTDDMNTSFSNSNDFISTAFEGFNPMGDVAETTKKEAEKMKLAIEDIFVLFDVKRAALEITIDTAPVKESTKIIKASLDSIPGVTTVEALVENINALASIAEVVTAQELIEDISREINMEIAGALDAIDMVEHRLAGIPDVTVKTLVMKVQTEASPRRPFSEGMKYIKEKINSLPSRRRLIIDADLPDKGAGIEPSIILAAPPGSGGAFMPGVNNVPQKVENTTNQNVEITVNITTKDLRNDSIDKITDEIAESLARKLDTGRANNFRQAIRRV